MKISLQNNTLIIQELDHTQYAIIKSWDLMKWHRPSRSLRGFATLELLDRLASIARLPPDVQARRDNLHAVLRSVDQQRRIPSPVPLLEIPVKAALFSHQIRAANMAAVAFGWVPPVTAIP